MVVYNERFTTLSNPEFTQFDKVKDKRSNRPDLHAMLLLSELFPRDKPMICSAYDDRIFFDVHETEIETLTDEQIIELAQCGVQFTKYGLCMWV